MRVVDANARVRTIRHVGAASIGVALLIAVPWVGWWTLIPFAVAALNLWHIDRRIARSPRPERVSALGILVTVAMLAVGVAISGGPRSPALPWMVLPAAMVAARFRPQVVIAGLAITVLAIFGATLGAAPDQTIHHPVSVLATLALLMSIVAIVWALQAAELHHRDEAILDPLTGLLNRHALAPRFNELSQQAELTGQPICLVLCDVNGFKAINDEFGHDRGDAVLRDIAYELRKRLRSFELVYRLGGEEFLIVLPGIDLAGGRRARRAPATGDRRIQADRHPHDDLARGERRPRRGCLLRSALQDRRSGALRSQARRAQPGQHRGVRTACACCCRSRTAACRRRTTAGAGLSVAFVAADIRSWND